jgi:hypothetical protein
MSMVEGERKEAHYMKDRERLVEAADALVNRLKELETEKAVLGEKLKTSEGQQEELQRKLSAAVTLIRSPAKDQVQIDEESLSEMNELRSSIARLLTSDTSGDRGVMDIKELRTSLSRFLTTGEDRQ